MKNKCFSLFIFTLISMLNSGCILNLQENQKREDKADLLNTLKKLDGVWKGPNMSVSANQSLMMKVADQENEYNITLNSDYLSGLNLNYKNAGSDYSLSIFSVVCDDEDISCQDEVTKFGLRILIGLESSEYQQLKKEQKQPETIRVKISKNIVTDNLDVNDFQVMKLDKPSNSNIKSAEGKKVSNTPGVTTTIEILGNKNQDKVQQPQEPHLVSEHQALHRHMAHVDSKKEKFIHYFKSLHRNVYWKSLNSPTSTMHYDPFLKKLMLEGKSILRLDMIENVRYVGESSQYECFEILYPTGIDRSYNKKRYIYIGKNVISNVEFKNFYLSEEFYGYVDGFIANNSLIENYSLYSENENFESFVSNLANLMKSKSVSSYTNGSGNRLNIKFLSAKEVLFDIAGHTEFSVDVSNIVSTYQIADKVFFRIRITKNRYAVLAFSNLVFNDINESRSLDYLYLYLYDKNNEGHVLNMVPSLSMLVLYRLIM